MSVSSNAQITFSEKKWPWDNVKHKPKTSSDHAQILMYDVNHFNVSDIPFGRTPFSHICYDSTTMYMSFVDVFRKVNVWIESCLSMSPCGSNCLYLWDYCFMVVDMCRKVNVWIESFLSMSTHRLNCLYPWVCCLMVVDLSMESICGLKGFNLHPTVSTFGSTLA